MRTTVNISDDLLAEAKVLAARTHRSIGAVIDDALRVLLRQQTSDAASSEWTFPTAGVGGLMPGVNLEDKEATADVLGDNSLGRNSLGHNAVS